MSISRYTPFGVPITTEAATSVSGGHISNTIAAEIQALGQQEYATNMADWTSEISSFKKFDTSLQKFASFDVLGFWKAKESMFPVLSRMVRDILSIQATSVASEFTFSTSGRVLSFRRTRLTPASLEMCMCLKDHLDATDRIQHTSNLENSLDFEVEILDEEVLASEAISLSDEEIILDEAASEARSYRSGEEYEITSD
ncbi:zinc finger BED domain-containing protein RICESLEEPER 2 [Tanacetum coccineum]